MKNNFPKITLVLSAAFFLGLCAVFVFLYREIDNNNKTADLRMATRQMETERLDQMASLNRSLDQSAPDIALLETHFAKSSDVVPFLDSIENLAPLTGTVAEINSVDTGTNNTKLVVDLKATGSFAGIYKFLTLLENSPYELDFISMDMHSLETSGASSKNIKNSNWVADFKIQLLSFVP